MIVLDDLPNELLDLVIGYLWGSAPIHDTVALANTCTVLCRLCQRVLFRRLSFVRTKDRNTQLPKIERRIELLWEFFQQSEALVHYARTLVVASEFRTVSWLQNNSFLRILITLGAKGDLVHLEIDGVGLRALDGRIFHNTIFRHLPTSVVDIHINNVRYLSPTVFSSLRQVETMKLSGVFYFAKGRRTIRQLLSRFRPPPTAERPSPTRFVYARQGRMAEEFTGLPAEVLTEYVNLDNVQVASFRTDHKDDWDVLKLCMKESRNQLLCLSIATEGVAHELFMAQTPIVMPSIPALSKLRRLSLETTYWSVWPESDNPFVGITRFLEAMQAPAIQELTISVVYRGFYGTDFERFLQMGQEWYALDSSIRRFVGSHWWVRVNLRLEGFDKQGLGDGTGGEEITTGDGTLHQMGGFRNLGKIEGRKLNESQMRVMLPRTYAVVRPRVYWS